MTKTMRKILAVISIMFGIFLILILIQGTNIMLGLPFAVVTMSLGTIVRLHP